MTREFVKNFSLSCAIATSSTSLKMIGSIANLNSIIYLYFHVLWARASQMLPKVPHSLQKVCKESPCLRGCISFRHCIEDEFCYTAFLTWFLMFKQPFVSKACKPLLKIFETSTPYLLNKKCIFLWKKNIFWQNLNKEPPGLWFIAEYKKPTYSGLHFNKWGFSNQHHHNNALYDYNDKNLCPMALVRYKGWQILGSGFRAKKERCLWIYMRKTT